MSPPSKVPLSEPYDYPVYAIKLDKEFFLTNSMLYGDGCMIDLTTVCTEFIDKLTYGSTFKTCYKEIS